MKYSYLVSYTCQDIAGKYSFHTAVCDSSVAKVTTSALEVVMIAAMQLLDDLDPSRTVISIQIAAIVAGGESKAEPDSNGNH